MNLPRVVLDSSVIVAGLLSQLGASNRLLELVAEQRVIPLVTTARSVPMARNRLSPSRRRKDIRAWWG